MSVKLMRKQLSRLHAQGVSHVLVANVIQQGLALLGVLFVAKLLPPEEFGLVRVAMAYVAVAVIIAGGGLTAPVLRYCADPSFNSHETRCILGKGLKNLAWICGAVTFLAILLILFLHKSNTEMLVFGGYALQIPALSLSGLLVVYLQAVQKFRYLAYSQVIVRFFGLIITVCSVWIYGIYGLLFAVILSSIIAVLPPFLIVRPKFQEINVPKDFFVLARYSVIGMMITTLGQYVDVLLLDWVRADRALIAVYSLATVFFFALGALAGAVQSVATPMFTNLIDDPEGLRSRLRSWTIGLTAVAIPVVVCVVLFAWSLEHWFLGASYSGLSGIVAILMLRFLLWCTYAVGGAAMVGIGAIKQGTSVAFCTTSLSLILGYFLCLEWSIWGAAWTQVIVALVSAILVHLIIRRELDRLKRHKINELAT